MANHSSAVATSASRTSQNSGLTKAAHLNLTTSSISEITWNTTATLVPVQWRTNVSTGIATTSANVPHNAEFTDAANADITTSSFTGITWNKIVISLLATCIIFGLVAGLIYYGIRRRRRAQLRRLLMSLRGEDDGEDMFGEADRSHATGGELGAFTEHDPADLRASRVPPANAGFNFAPSSNFGIGSAAARLGLNFSPRLGFRSGFFAGGSANAASNANASARQASVRENEQARLLDEQSAEPEDDLIFGTRARASAPSEQHVTMESLNGGAGGNAATISNPRARASPDNEAADEFGEYRSETQPSRFGVWGRMFGSVVRNARAPPPQTQHKPTAPPDDLLLDDHNVDSVATSSARTSRPRDANAPTSTSSQRSQQQWQQEASVAKASEKAAAATGAPDSSSRQQQQQQTPAARSQSKGLFLPARLQNVAELDEDDEPILELGSDPK